MTPKPHQVRISEQGYEALKANGLVYLAMEERTGKTLTSILICEKSPFLKNILIITKKKALMGVEDNSAEEAEGGWHGTLNQYQEATKNYTVTNYHSLHKIRHTNFDLVILDEAHAYLSKYPIRGEIWKAVSRFTKCKPIIYLSATPSAQSYSMLFHQLALSTWSPWSKYSNFYNWFAFYGKPRTRFIGGKQFKEYHDTQSEWIKQEIAPFFISYTRKELGFEHEPEDVLHFVPLSPNTVALYKKLETSAVVHLGDELITAETPMSEMSKLHQIEGGTIKKDDKTSFIIGNTEKIDYIKENFGDTEELVIYYHYIKELELLKKHFKKAMILQAISFAEGVDLCMKETVVVYSMNFSTSQYTQRRARQANMDRKTPIRVHFILSAGAVSHQVYTTVAINKTNFVDKYYEKGLL